jgi:YegS/Rv2252/BmrU family lipid kinase
MSGPLFIVNPASAGGRTGRRWVREILPLLPGRFGPDAAWAFTEKPGDAATIAERASREGRPMVVAVGGDGTLHEVVNGLMGVAGKRVSPLLGLVPNGTGCDFARTIDVPRDPARALEILAGGRSVLADVCEISCVGGDGARVRRFSINTCGCGIGGHVAAGVNRWTGRRHGFLAFLAAALSAVARYRPDEAAIAVDGAEAVRVRLLALFVCNGRYCGGGMRPGNDARIDDGRLRVVAVEAMHPARVLLNLPRLYSGRVEGVRGVHVCDASRVEVSASGSVLVDCDGELPGTAPASFIVRPAALRVIVGEGSASRAKALLHTAL